MNLLLALNYNQSQGVDSLDKYILYVSLGIVFIISIILMFYFSPAQVLARAIKEVGLKENKKMYILEETEEYFLIDSGVRIYKSWYNTDNDCYISDYGFYIPIYERDNFNSFLFMRK